MAFTLAHRKADSPASEWVFEVTGSEISEVNGRYKKGPDYGKLIQFSDETALRPYGIYFINENNRIYTEFDVDLQDNYIRDENNIYYVIVNSGMNLRHW